MYWWGRMVLCYLRHTPAKECWIQEGIEMRVRAWRVHIVWHGICRKLGGHESYLVIGYRRVTRIQDAASLAVVPYCKVRSEVDYPDLTDPSRGRRGRCDSNPAKWFREGWLLQAEGHKGLFLYHEDIRLAKRGK